MTPARILDVSGAEAGAAAFREAAAILSRGGLVAHPTETLYGLAVDPWNPEGLARLARLKGREAGAGFILIAADGAQAAGLVAQPPPALYAELSGAFWPGPLTLVIPPAPGAPAGVAGPGGGIAVRVTPDPVAQALLRSAGQALTSTSANRSGATPASSAAGVLAALGEAVDLILDGGAREGGVPSTLVDLTGPAPRLLREGAVGRERLREATGGVIE